MGQKQPKRKAGWLAFLETVRKFQENSWLASRFTSDCAFSYSGACAEAALPSLRPATRWSGPRGQTLSSGGWLPGAASQSRKKQVARAPFQVRQLIPSVSPPEVDYYPRPVLLAQLLSVPVVHKGHGLIIAAFSPAMSTGLAYSRCSVPASQWMNEEKHFLGPWNLLLIHLFLA